MAYTSGPWKAHKSVTGFVDIETEDGMIRLAGMFPVENSEANARLMAAAPRLLEVLEAIVREGDSATATRDWPTAELFAAWAVDQARAALQAAEGEEYNDNE
jgi:hypothetical protein